MNNIWTGSLMAALILLIRIPTATAIPIISIDLDSTTPGIQSVLAVTTGSSFTVNVVYTGDGVAMFDTFAFDAVFNDLGGVLGLAGGTGLPTAGSIAATAPVTALDAFTAGPVAPGSPLTPSGVPFPIPAPFTAGSDGLGVLSIVLPFGLIGGGVTIDLFSVTFDALIEGTSGMAPSAGVISSPLGGLALAGLPVAFSLAGGTVTVARDGVIPEPSILILFGLGLAGLGWSRRKKA